MFKSGSMFSDVSKICKKRGIKIDEAFAQIKEILG